MSAPSYSDSPRSATNYLGQNYRFTPTYIRRRNPTDLDVRPKENQGFYPVGSLWINISSPPEIWILASITSNVDANWVLVANSLIVGPLLTLSDNSGTVVHPSSNVANPPGNIQFLAGPGVTIVGDDTNHTMTITSVAAAAETLTGDDGVAVSQSGGTIQTLGNTVANSTHAKPLFTQSGGGNIERFDIQVAAAIAATNINKAGLAAFNNTQFTVDANGFVSLMAAATVTLTGDDGVAVSPSGGTIQTLGNTVANSTHAKALFTTNSAGNIERFDIQVGAAIAATDITKVGLVALNNTQFTVDANGFVSLIGGTTPPTLGIVPDAHTAPGTTPVTPNGSGNIILEGGSTFATNTQANPIRTNSLAANTVDLQIQLAGSNAAVSTANKFGVAQFDSNSFTVTNGYVALSGGGTTGAITKVNLDTGTTPIVPSAGAITLTGSQVAAGSTTNVIRTNGTGANTGSIQIQRSQAVASSTVGDNGVSHFSSSSFTVDANGFVKGISAVSNGYFSLATGVTNVTGDNTNYTILYDTTKFHNGTDITYNAGTGTFTCNTTGIYALSAFVTIADFNNGVPDGSVFTKCFYNFSTGNGMPAGTDNPGAHFNPDTSGHVSYQMYGILNMNATDTFQIHVQVDGGTKVLGLSGNSGVPDFGDNNFVTYFRIG